MKSLLPIQRSIPRLGLFLGMPSLTLLSYCSGGGAEFTVVNETNEPLYTWAFYEKCEDSPGNQQDYFVQDIVEARESFEYRYGYGSSGNYPKDEVRCVQVADEQRRLVLSEPYQPGKRYVVTDATPIRRDPLPAVYELPSQSWSDGMIEEISENPVAYAVLSPFLAGFVVMLFIALPYGIYRSVKDLLRYRREGAAQEE